MSSCPQLVWCSLKASIRFNLSSYRFFIYLRFSWFFFFFSKTDFLCHCFFLFILWWHNSFPPGSLHEQLAMANSVAATSNHHQSWFSNCYKHNNAYWRNRQQQWLLVRHLFFQFKFLFLHISGTANQRMERIRVKSSHCLLISVTQKNIWEQTLEKETYTAHSFPLLSSWLHKEMSYRHPNTHGILSCSYSSHSCCTSLCHLRNHSGTCTVCSRGEKDSEKLLVYNICQLGGGTEMKWFVV